MTLVEVSQRLANYIWQPLFVILLALGLYLTVRLKGLQFRYLWYSLKLAFKRHDHTDIGDISQFQALTTALAATIGIGNIAGIATAVATGGLGALFWVWITCLVSMSIKYAEATLSVRYRAVDARGEMSGGPMHYIDRGLGWKPLAMMFALFGMIATITTGSLIQSNSIASALSGYYQTHDWIVGLLLALCTGLVLVGGIKSIGKVTAVLVPLMALFYFFGSCIVIGCNLDSLSDALHTIFVSAFTGQAAVGGFIGSTMIVAMQMGVARGVFSSETGLGSSSIAAAAAKTDYPSRQALISMVGSFLSTIICTFTGLAIAVTHVLGTYDSHGKLLNGAYMTVMAFEKAFPYGGLVVIVCCILFGLSTIIGWSYYGEKCCEYLFGLRSVPIYRMIFILCVFLGVIIPLDLIWSLADIANAFMALPNLIGILFLTSVVCQETDFFFKKRAASV